MAKKVGTVPPTSSDYVGRDAEQLIEVPRPLSLTAGPSLSYLNAVGIPEAQAIVEAYRPQFVGRLATPAEMEAMAW